MQLILNTLKHYLDCTIRLLLASFDNEWAGFVWVVVIVLLATLYIFLMSGWQIYSTPEKDKFEVKLHPNDKQCAIWDQIIKEIVNHTQCSKERKINNSHVCCTRRLGHEGPHHMHVRDYCRWIW